MQVLAAAELEAVRARVAPHGRIQDGSPIRLGAKDVGNSQHYFLLTAANITCPTAVDREV